MIQKFTLITHLRKKINSKAEEFILLYLDDSDETEEQS